MELEFTPIVIDNNQIDFNDCKHFISLNHDTDTWYLTLYLLYSPSSSDIEICGNQIVSFNEFYISASDYIMHDSIHDDLHYSSYELLNSSFAISQGTYVAVPEDIDFPQGVMHCYHYYNFGQIIYSSDVIYYLWDGVDDLDNGSLTRFGYNNPWYMFFHLYKDDDISGWLVDRRIFNINDSDDDNIIRDPIDYKDFNGVLGFNSFYPKSSLNSENGVDWNIQPFTYIKYTLNNYTRLQDPEDVIIRFETQCYCKVTLQNGLYQSYLWQTYIDYPVSDAPDELFINYNYLNNADCLYKDNFKNESQKLSFSDYLEPDRSTDYDGIDGQNYLQVINYWFKRQPAYEDDLYPDNGSYKIVDMVIKYDTETHLYQLSNGKSSKKTKFSFDAINKKSTYDDNIIYNDDKEFSDFITDHDFDSDEYPVIYVPTDNDTTITDDRDISIVVNDNPFPYILVDIPENQYIDSTPRLRDMMSDIVGAVGEDRQGSIIQLVKEEYNYLPEQATRYITYAVGVICLLGFWKMIRR